MIKTRVRKNEEKTNYEEDDRLREVIKNLKGKYKVVGLVDELLEKEKETRRIPLSILSLQSIFGGGLPLGRVIEIFGKESTGKSTLTMQIIGDAQKEGLSCAFIDMERCYIPSYAQKLGIDNSKLILASPVYGEEAFGIVQSLVEEANVKLVVIDSVAALMPQEESSGESLGSQARMMSKYLRRIIPILSENGATLIFINQVRKTISTSWMNGPQETTTGGLALKFFSSIRMEIKKIKTIFNSQNETIGGEIKLSTLKNKMDIPFKSVSLMIYSGEGFSRILDSIKWAEKYGIIERSGGWFKMKGKNIANGQEQVKNYFLEAKELEDLEKEIKDHIQKDETKKN